MAQHNQDPKTAMLNDEDHGASITIATGLGLVYMLLTCATRLYTRHVLRGFGLEDTTIVLATLVGFVQNIIVFIGVAEGLGKSITLLDSQQLLELEKLAYAGDILFIITLCLSKCSVILLLKGLTRNVNHRKACKVILGLCATWGVASVLAVALRCRLAHPWLTVDVHCTGLYLRWQLITVFNIVTEAALVSMAIYLVWSLQMKVKMKAGVVAAFTFRLPIIVAACFRLHDLALAYNSPNPTLGAVPAVIMTQVEMNYSLIAATIPCLRPIMRALSTGFLGGPIGGRYGSSYTSAGSYALQSMSSDPTPTTGANTQAEQDANRKTTRPARVVTRTAITHAPSSRREDAESMESIGSEQLIVRHTREWLAHPRFEGRAYEDPDMISRA